MNILKHVLYFFIPANRTIKKKAGLICDNSQEYLLIFKQHPEFNIRRNQVQFHLVETTGSVFLGGGTSNPDVPFDLLK